MCKSKLLELSLLFCQSYSFPFILLNAWFYFNPISYSKTHTQIEREKKRKRDEKPTYKSQFVRSEEQFFFVAKNGTEMIFNNLRNIQIFRFNL